MVVDMETEATEKPKKTYPPLDQETRTTIPTKAAAFYLNREPQTLYSWSCLGNGPIKPVRINGRISWRVADIKALSA